MLLRCLTTKVTDEDSGALSLAELDDIRASGKELWTVFARVHDAIIDSCTEEFMGSDYVVNNLYATAFQLYSELNQRIAKLTNQLHPRVNTDGHSSGNANAGSRAALPKIALPTFSGQYSEWCSFRDLFTALVRENAQITDVERMHYLRASTTGEAAKLIASMAIEADSFPTAWETLVERYENKRLLVASHLESLFNKSVISSRSARDLHALQSTITEACNSLKALGAPIQHWDWVLVFAISRRLDTPAREAWELQAGKSRVPPTFADLRHFIGNRARALEGAELGRTASGTGSGATSKPSGSRVHAVTAADSSKACGLCQERHYIGSCAKFRQLSNEARRAEVGRLRLCFNCLGKHNVNACQITTRCKECDRKHHTMIHVGWSKFGEKPTASGSSDRPSSGAGPSTSGTAQ